MTVQRLFRRKYGPALIIRIKRFFLRQDKGLRLRPAMESKKMKDGYVAGHFGFGVHHYLPTPYEYIAFFREPISRLKSLYYFSKTNPTAFLHKFAKDASPEEFFFNKQVIEADNGQLRYIIGNPVDLFIDRRPFGTCDEKMLEEAKSNIEKHFSFVGITEQFDSSLLLLKEKLNWNHCYYLRRNTSAKKTKTEPIDQETIDKLKELNRHDIELYSYVKARFETEANKYDLLNPSTIESFRKVNTQRSAVILPFYNIYDSLKARIKGNPNRAR